MFAVKFNVGPFVASVKAAEKKLARDVIQAIKKSAETARDHAKATSLFKNRTGELRSKIKVRWAGSYHAQTHTGDTKHAAWVEYGNGFRRPGQEYIYPKKAKFLRFEINGQTFFRRRVKHSKPRPYMAEAREHAVPVFERLCVEAVNTMFG